VGTRGSGTIIETEYIGGESVQYEQETSVDVGFDWSLGMTEPTLLEPIDYDTELAERHETHEPIADVGGDLSNSLSGV
jgi:hypothetical protein